MSETSATSSAAQLQATKDKCPAFQEGCPFKGMRLEEALSRCPAFRDGCPFRGASSLADVFEIFQDVDLQLPEHQTIPDLFKQMHELSSNLRTDLGLSECPLFSTEQGCPFKTLSARGVPIVHELEMNTWSVLTTGARPERMMEAVLPLSKQLKEGTKESHSAAENVHFVREFLQGKVPRAVYASMLKDLFHVYTALENAADAAAQHPLFGRVHFPKQLRRWPALERDMAFYLGAAWRDLPQCLPSDAAKRYCERIAEVAASEPELLIAHSYTRYLGDLSGGRVLMRVAIKTYDLHKASQEGVQFYVFEEIEDGRAFKRQYRSALDDLQLDADTAARVIKEANAAFYFNMDLFKELDRQLGLQDTPVPQAPAPSKCPFAPMMQAGGALSKQMHQMHQMHRAQSSVLPFTKLLGLVLAMAAVACAVWLGNPVGPTAGFQE